MSRFAAVFRSLVWPDFGRPDQTDSFSATQKWLRLLAGCCSFVVVSASAISNAQTTEFPYKARVVKSDVYARCGAGDSFYPTDELSKDSIVTVLRHDPGGWYTYDSAFR